MPADQSFWVIYYQIKVIFTHIYRGFSLNCWWGGLKIFCPRRYPVGTKSDGGGTCKKKKKTIEAETAYLMQN